MNRYKLLIFDGYVSRIIYAQGSDIPSAMMGTGITYSHVIKAELVGAADE